MKNRLRDIFNKVSLSYPDASSLVCFTEAVFITNPKPEQIRKWFSKLVSKEDREDINFTRNQILKDTFGDMLLGEKTLKNERLII